MTVRTDGTVKNVRLYNEYGLSMGRKEYQAAAGEDEAVFTMQINIGTVGSGRALSVFVQTEDGGAYVDSGVKLTLDVLSAAPQVISVQAPQAMVVNRASDIVVVTDRTAEKVTVYNEYGLSMLTAKTYRETEVGREFILPLKIGTAGTRNFTAVAVNRWGVKSEAKEFGPITVKYF